MDRERAQKIENIVNKIATIQILLNSVQDEIAADLPSEGSPKHKLDLETTWLLNQLNDAGKYLDQAYDVMSNIVEPEQSSSPMLDHLIGNLGSDVLEAMMSSFSHQEKKTEE